MGLEACLREGIELDQGGDPLTEDSFDVSKASFLHSTVCKHDLGLGPPQCLSDPWNHPNLGCRSLEHSDTASSESEKQPSAECKNRKRGSGSKGRS